MNIIQAAAQLRIFTFEEHQIGRHLIDRDALNVIETLQKAGFEAYAVGGCVRDLLLGADPKDWDVSTSAEPEEIKKLFRACILIGKRFRLAHVRFGRNIIEVSTFRKGDNKEDQIVLSDNVYGSAEEDALRRDFTINALFYDPKTETIIDYVNGYADVAARYLRSIGPAHLRFKQDPVRMIRLLKFQARFDLEIDHEALLGLAECRDDILKSSQARVFEELLRMLELGYSAKFFHLLHEQRFLMALLPTLAKFLSDKAHPDRHGKVFSMLELIDKTQKERVEIGKRPLSRPVLLASLLFPYMEHHLHTHFLSQGTIPHLGEVQTESRTAINEVFSTFFILPNQLRYATSTVLATQYRFCPLQPGRRPSYKVPNDPDFKHALKFFNIRSLLDPTLAANWERWNSAYEKYKIQNPNRGQAIGDPSFPRSDSPNRKRRRRSR